VTRLAPIAIALAVAAVPAGAGAEPPSAPPPLESLHLAPTDAGRRLSIELAGLSTAGDQLDGGRLEVLGGSLVADYHHPLGATVLSVTAGLQAWAESHVDDVFGRPPHLSATNVVVGVGRWLGAGPVRASLRGRVILPTASGDPDTIHHIRAIDHERFTPDWPGVLVNAGLRADGARGFVQAEVGAGAHTVKNQDGIFPSGELRAGVGGGVAITDRVHLVGELGAAGFAIHGTRISATLGVGVRIGDGELSLRGETRLGTCRIDGAYGYPTYGEHCALGAARYTLRF